MTEYTHQGIWLRLSVRCGISMEYEKLDVCASVRACARVRVRVFFVFIGVWCVRVCCRCRLSLLHCHESYLLICLVK